MSPGGELCDPGEGRGPGQEGGLRQAEETGLLVCLVIGAKGMEGRGWQVSNGLAPKCSLEGTETPTEASPW